MQRLRTLVPGHLSSHSALSSYGLFSPLSLWQLSVSLRPLVQTLRSCPASGAPWSSAIPPFLARGRVTHQQHCLFTTSGPTLRSCPASGAPWSSAIPPFLGRGRVTQQQQHTMYFTKLNHRRLLYFRCTCSKANLDQGPTFSF